jgi:putative ubiquitin-RnfH superfamily antitoxin RatB of RatAB toxin-antitoxin module
MGSDDLISVELVFATKQRQLLLTANVAVGTLARDALLKSDLVAEFSDVDFANCPLGIWGKPVSGNQVLKNGDRLEAYRSLLRDPREARRELALSGKTMGGSGEKM